MAAVIRKFLPSTSKNAVDDDDDSFNMEYSIAVPYDGPLNLNSKIPKAYPVEFHRIPTATKAVSSSSLVNAPVIDPIRKKESASNVRLESKPVVHLSSTSSRVGSSATIGCASSEERILESSDSKCSENLSESREFSERCQSPNHRIEGDSSEEFSERYQSPIGLAVTFAQSPSDIADEEESDDFTIPPTPKAERKGKKGSCYGCLMGNRFTEKETCIVCDAKYCSDCVVRRMGAMPEGRKCITCTKKRIDESKRASLGKSSRMLRRLLGEFEVKRIMNDEIMSRANQLPPQLIYVNDESLDEEELRLLQTCRNPPKNLKPGRYWYDKVCGYWGPQGERPCQIISIQMNIGGSLKKTASNGNCSIEINNREITKAELLMLQMIGVQCDGKPHFWLSPNGDYQEVGQNHVKGNLWKKKRARVACALLSLPMDPNYLKHAGEEENSSSNNRSDEKALYKVLLVGSEKSGTSTMYKQAKLLYDGPFSEDEQVNLKLMIQTNLYKYLGILLEGREKFEEESLAEISCNQSPDQSVHSGDVEKINRGTIYSLGPKQRKFADWYLEIMASGNLEIIFPAASREYAPLVEELWKDAAIQATYSRRGELEKLPRMATYFLERAAEISKPDYEPSDMDIIYSEGAASSVGLSSVEFSFPKVHEEGYLDSYYRHDPSTRYQLIRVHPKCLGENCKWLEMFEDVDIIVFCVSLTEYDEYLTDDNGLLVNKMVASKQLFESIVTYPDFIDKKFLLLLNKFDLFQEKIEHVPLSQCEWFRNFSPFISRNQKSTSNRNNPTMAHNAYHFIASEFKNLFRSLTDPLLDNGNRNYWNYPKLFVSQVTGLDSDSVDQALRYVRIILKWEIEEPLYPPDSPSMDASTIS